FLSIPVSIAGSFFDIYRGFSTDDYFMLFVCFIVNVFLSLLIMKKVLEYLKTRDLYFFGYYRIVLGAILMWLR
ncbi:MAG: hypothetical protein LBP39_02160, partial [Rickettsiales bacterium]|nr:hypothetical protein [Rickettsiales bacterium]